MTLIADEQLERLPLAEERTQSIHDAGREPADAVVAGKAHVAAVDDDPHARNSRIAAAAAAGVS